MSDDLRPEGRIAYVRTVRLQRWAGTKICSPVRLRGYQITSFVELAREAQAQDLEDKSGMPRFLRPAARLWWFGFIHGHTDILECT
ncbi:hypothetical protein AO073_21685 [Pseudomonas syringae ICMP 11293]|nr:hypothetical protein AO073_21685 [Pseudomonas syringae ICMP 11293]PHN78274.1 hypothetical protein AO071_22400 [Pseudomonas syringae]